MLNYGEKMAIPKFEEFYLPVLEYFKDGEEHSKKEISEYIVEYFELTEQDLNEKTAKGNEYRYKDRVNWAVTHLFRATLLERIQRGKYKISENGSKVLNDGIDMIDSSFLNEYPSFRMYKGNQLSNNIEEDSDDNRSPSERLDDAFYEINEELSSSLLDEIKTKNPYFFEKLVVDLLLKMGYGGFREDAGSPTQLTHDGGIDGIINEDILGLDKIAIQAKRHENTIGRPDIQRFSGALTGIKKGVFITTSSFSDDAIEFVNRQSEKSIVLIDGKELAELMIKYDVGVSTIHSYDIKNIDNDYFDSED